MVEGPSLRRRIAWGFTSLSLLFGLFVAALTNWALYGPLIQPLCAERPPFVKPLSPRQAVFVAKALWVGRIDRDHAAQTGHNLGHWALALVQRRYWGLPWWSSKVVFLANGGFEKGEEYFVDGDRSSLVSYFVPLVHIGTCTRSVPLDRADIDLRILRDGPPESRVRIIGRIVRQPSGRPQESVPGMKVEIIGPSGRLFAISDAQGVYDADGLPPGHYALSVGSADQLDFLPPYSRLYQHDLKVGDVWGRTLWVK
jgi:hypothetical protein